MLNCACARKCVLSIRGNVLLCLKISNYNDFKYISWHIRSSHDRIASCLSVRLGEPVKSSSQVKLSHWDGIQSECHDETSVYKMPLIYVFGVA